MEVMIQQTQNKRINLNRSRILSKQDPTIPQGNKKPKGLCDFFDFSCAPNFIKNKETLINQKNTRNQTEIQLLTFKILSNKNFSKQKRLKSVQQKAQKNQGEQNSHKGIGVSLTAKYVSTQLRATKHNIKDHIKNINEVSPFNIPSTAENMLVPQRQFLNLKNQQNILHHQINPLNKNKYDRRRITIGKQKVFIQEKKVVMLQIQSEVTGRITLPQKDLSSTKRPKVVFQTQKFIQPEYSPNSNYLFVNCNHSLYQNRPVSFQSSIGTKITPNQLHFNYLTTQKSNFQQQSIILSNDSKYLQSTNHIISNSPNPIFINQTTTQVFNNIQINHPIQQNSKGNQQQSSSTSIQNYSSKYEQYMSQELKQLCYNISKIQKLQDETRKIYGSVNKEHHQQSQRKNHLQMVEQKNQDKMNNQMDRSRKGQFSSSFIVVESKQKTLENMGKIYQSSNIDSSSNVDPYINHSQQLLNMPNSAYIHNIHSQRQSLFPSQSFHNITAQIQTLTQELQSLLQQQQHIKSQRSTLCLQRLAQLQHNIKQLQKLKQLAEQRRQSIQYLRELFKIKKVNKMLKSNESLRTQFLDDQKAQQHFVDYGGGIQKLSNQNNQTQPEKIINIKETY